MPRSTISRRLLATASAAAALGAFCAPMPAIAMQRSFDFNIPAQDLGPALRALARASGEQVIFEGAAVRGRRSSPVSGSLTADAALQAMLQGTGLAGSRSRRGILVVAAGAQTSGDSATSGEGMAGGAAADSGSADQEIVVVGTNIRGVYPSSSPVEIYSARDIERTGATTTEQFIRKLPQNLGSRTAIASGSVGTGAFANTEGTSGINLRGLGGGASLVLMNGRRLGRSDFGRTADISLIPASAIDRVEVLTDGASAIYGSDAVSGVVNFVLRDDFDGAETRLAFGGVTSGGLRQGEFTQTFGRSWASGHALISYSAFFASALEVADRSFAAAADRGYLTPVEERHNVLAAFSQDLSDRLTISGDLALARRNTERVSTFVNNPNTANWVLSTHRAETDQAFADLSIEYQIAEAQRASLTASYSVARVSEDDVSTFYRRIPPQDNASYQRTKRNSIFDLTAMFDGRLFSVPGGEIRYSLGFGFMQEDYSGATILIVNPTNGRTLGRTTTYAFGELFIPLIGVDQNVPLVNRLELNLAARYTRIDDDSSPALQQDFGDAVDPKIGLLWAPFDFLNLRATYGTSFRAPSLIELDTTNAQNILSGTRRIPFPNGPLAATIVIDGIAAPDLEPERAESFTIGFDFRPRSLGNLRISGTYYNISYTDRIGRPPTGGTAFVQTPELFPIVIYRPPSVEFIENILRTTRNVLNTTGVNLSDPRAAAVALFNHPNAWIQDFRARNLAISEQDGFDFSFSNSHRTSWGQVRYGGSATLILSYRQQSSSDSAVVSMVDRLLQPVDLRGRAYVGLTRGGFEGTLSVNYVDDYANDLGVGGAEIESWTTADLNLSYDFGRTRGPLRGVRLSLSVQNLFDSDPPRVSNNPANVEGLIDPIGFDPANADPLGRVIVFGLTKSW